MRPDEFGMLTCAECGEYQPKSAHRKYFPSQTNGEDRESYYKQCKRCERINKRYAYLIKKTDPTEQDLRDINVTERLYKELTARGYEVPAFNQGIRKSDDSAINLLNKITKGRVTADSIEHVNMEPESYQYNIAEQFVDEPGDLLDMLYKELHGIEPDALYRQYDELKDKYAPQIGVDEGNNYAPIIDQRHSEILQAIIERINEYEDGLY